MTPELVSYRRTPEFDESSVPAGLLRTHDTKEGVWARVCVIDGRVELAFEDTDESVIVTSTTPALISPQRPHHLVLRGAVRFFVEFCRPIDDES